MTKEKIPAEYDVNFIREYADALYAQALTIIPIYFFIGIFLGLLLFGAIGVVLTFTVDFVIASIGVIVGGILGYSSGKTRAEGLKLQAQLALCQAKIEENTRSTS